LTDVNNPNHFRDIGFNGGNGISARNVIIPSGNVTYSLIGTTTRRLWRLGLQCTTDWTDSAPLFPGEEVKFFVTRKYVDASPFVSPVWDASFKVIPGSYVYSTIDRNTIVTGSPISIRDVLPTKFKQKDFLVSIFRMFNLYIEPFSTNGSSRNSFFIEPRDDYYNSGTTKDWSDKLDISKSISTEFISNQQKRTNLFTHKEDKDIYNQNYKTSTETIFGQFKYEIENDFISGDNKIETSFSPTPIDRLPGSQNIYLPIISNSNNGNYSKPDGMNPRILYKKMINLTGTDLLLIDYGLSFSKYPYAGFATDPINPEYSINFGQVSSFYTGYNETINNLFNVFYSNQISELNDPNNRIIEAYFYLNALDINDFKFNDLIYFNIDNMVGYYRITKIYDYDPSTNSSTKVQFIKAINYSLDGSVNYNRINSYQESGLRNLVSVDNVYIGVISTSTTNTTTTPNVAMIGTNNSVAFGNVLSVGDSNSSYARNSVLVGQSNQSTTDQTLIVGDTNIVNGLNSIAIGSGNLVSTPQSLVIGIGNQIESQEQSITGSQSSIIVGNNNQMLNDGGFVYGSNNLIGLSVSNSFVFGSNNDIGFTASGPSGSTFDNVFIVGSNISLTQSSSSLFYVGYDTIEFNTQNFITNVVGTSSFNNMVIADLLLQDIPNNTSGKFRLNQYNPADYPGGSYLQFVSPAPGLEIVYNDFDSGYFYINRANAITSEYQAIFMDDDEVKINLSKTNSNTEFSILPDGYEFRNSSPGSFNSNTETKINKQAITSTSSTTTDIVISTGLTDYQHFEVVILGSDQIANQRYSSRKVAMFKSSPFSQVGTTETIYEITNMGTYSTNIQIQGTTIVVRVSGSVANDTRWSIYATSYQAS
jgi:hypothetical protein